MDKDLPSYIASDLTAACRVLLRAKMLIEVCGEMKEPIPTLNRLAEIIVNEMAAGEVDEDRLVKLSVKTYLLQPF